MNPIIIIGSGLAGYTLAREFRQYDQHTPLLIITANDGRFYSKPLLSSALKQQKSAEKLVMASAETMAKQLNAEIRPYTIVTAVIPEEHCVYVDNERVIYSQLVLACGAEIIRPPLQGNAVQDLHFVNDLEDYTRFRQAIHDKKHLAILGAGLVGCEFANDLLHAGHHVDVIAPSHQPLELLLPEPLAKVLQNALQAAGVRWHLAQTAISFNKNNDNYELTLASGEILLVDVVLSAIGLRPHVKLAVKAGLQVQRGIVVNRFLQTSVSDIFALGDCAEVNGLVLLFVAPLTSCARALAKTLAGNPTEVDYPAMPVIIKTPALPLVVNPPPRGLIVEWEISGEGRDWKALCYDAQHQLRGFALTGKAITEKTELVKQLRDMFAT
jgi:rubredoxin-NAD+ reductase